MSRSRKTPRKAPRPSGIAGKMEAMPVLRPLRPLRAGSERRSAAKAGRPLVESRLQDLVVITGFSGAGKSTAMNVFEDAGYFCVDNLPPELIRSLVEVFAQGGSKVERAAVVSDVRGGVYFEALRAVVDDLDALGVSHHVLFLANPHYEADLRELTGLDEPVVEYIARDGRLGELYERLFPLLDFLLPQYVSEGKAHLVIAIGCTGGRHRSVAIAEHLAERYRDHEDLDVAVAHRDIDKVPRGS